MAKYMICVQFSKKFLLPLVALFWGWFWFFLKVVVDHLDALLWFELRWREKMLQEADLALPSNAEKIFNHYGYESSFYSFIYQRSHPFTNNTWYKLEASVDPSPIIVFQFNVNDLSVIFVASNSCGCGGNISVKIEHKM